MGKQEIRCGICKGASLGYAEDPKFIEGGESPTLDDRHACEDCAPLWNKFRVDIDAEDLKAIEMSRDLLTLRGATALDLHLKILATEPAEAQKLASLGADFTEAIMSDATTEDLVMLGVTK